jgi:solute carrier family 25 carnitine/acylcarnitine transporter 20/29
VQREGSRALFKGMSSPLLSSSVCNALCFHTYAATGRFLSGSDAGPRSYTHTFAAGCTAGAATTVLVTPIEVLKIRLQVQRGRAQGPLALAASIVSQEGLRGLFRGTGVTLLRDTPSTGLYYAVYEVASRNAAGGRGAGTDAATLLAGALAGVCSWLSIYPVDVLKSRMQASPGSYSSMLDCARRSFCEEGPAVFSRGLPACLLRAALVNAAIFGGYEAALELLQAL